MRLFLLLLKLKVRLVVRHLSRKGWLTTFLFYGVYCPFMIWGVFIFCRDGVGYLREMLPNWVLPIYVVIGYALWILLAIMWELQQAFVLDVAQRSTENDYLASLPVPLPTIVMVKSLERMTSDVSLPLGLGAALGFTAAVSPRVLPLVLTAVAIVESSWLLGVLLFLFHMVLARRYTVSQIRQFSFLAQPFALIPFGGLLAVHSLVSDAQLPAVLMEIRPWISWLPPYRFASGILNWERGGLLGCTVPLLLLAAAGAAVIAWIRQLERWGWELSPVPRPPERPPEDWYRDEPIPIHWPKKRFLKGLYWKDALLLLRDRNLLGNGLLLPLIVSFGMLFGLANDLKNAPSILMSICLWFTVYFNGLGAMNAAGMEGNGIWFARSLPVSARGFLGRKAAFWAVLTEILFLPLVALIGYTVGLTPPCFAKILLPVALLAPLVATLAVSLSAVFANYEAQVLQQGSTLAGKGLYFLLAGALIPLGMQTDWKALQMVAFAVVLVGAIFSVGVRALLTHGDPDVLEPGRVHATDGIIFIAGFVIVQPALTGFLANVFPPHVLPVAHWMAQSLLLAATLGMALWYLHKRCGSVAVGRGVDRTRLSFATVGVAMGLAGLALLSAPMARYLPGVLSPLQAGVQAVERTLAAISLCSGVLWWLPLGCILFLIPTMEEVVLRVIIQRGLAQDRWPPLVRVAVPALLMMAIYPSGLALFMGVYGLVLALLYESAGSVAAPLLLRVLFNLLLFVQVSRRA